MARLRGHRKKALTAIACPLSGGATDYGAVAFPAVVRPIFSVSLPNSLVKLTREPVPRHDRVLTGWAKTRAVSHI
jgi:hypothetical protein